MAKRLSTRTSTTKSAVYEHFALSSDGKHYVCQCIQNDGDGEKQCDAKISSFSGHDKNAPTRASNLKRHLHRFHPKVLEAVNEKDSNESIASRSVPKNVQKSTGTQSQIRKFFVSDKVTITMTPEKFKTHIIEMVVKNSLPLSFFSQPAFLGLNGEMAKKLGVSLERENIRKLIIEEAKCKKEELRKVLKGLLPEIPPQEEVQSTCGNSGSSSSNEELDFDSFLDKMEVSKGKRRRISIKEPVDVQIKKYRMEFFKELKEVEKYARSSKLSVEEAILVYPEIISDVARIVTAMPPTQVSVERLFSALKIIKSDLRASMKEDLAEAILFLRTLH